MPSAASDLVNKVWNYCNLLRDDGVSYGDYVEQLTSTQPREGKARESSILEWI